MAYEYELPAFFKILKLCNIYNEKKIYLKYSYTQKGISVRYIPDEQVDLDKPYKYYNYK